MDIIMPIILTAILALLAYFAKGIWDSIKEISSEATDLLVTWRDAIEDGKISSDEWKKLVKEFKELVKAIKK